jgi:flagellar protein FlgJ
MHAFQAAFIREVLPAVLGLQERTGLPASVVLAQAILESNWGRSELAREHRNYFGIKAHGRPKPSDVVDYLTTEYREGQERREKAGFAHYDSVDDCLNDYARILSLRRYAPARAVVSNPPAFARALQRCGYATDPRYAHKLLIVMRRYRLDQYDRAAVAVEAT